MRCRAFHPGPHHPSDGALRLPDDHVQQGGHRTDVAVSETVVGAAREYHHMRAARYGSWETVAPFEPATR